MTPQRLHFGQTEQEDRVIQAFFDWHVSVLINQCYCFQCSNIFRRPKNFEYPSECGVCGFRYSQRGQYCQPDLILQKGTQFGAVFVNGKVHEKRRVAIKEKSQVSELLHRRVRVIIIGNDAVDNMPVSVLRAWARTAFDALFDDKLYCALYMGEKEIPALRGIVC